MESKNRFVFVSPVERVSALLLAALATLLIFGAISAGFTPLAVDPYVLARGPVI
jgi:hypothetical protein